MMKVRINILGKTEEGRSRATGNPWKAKEVVVEFKGADGYVNTIFAKAFNNDVISRMEMMKEGDVVNAEFVFVATSRRFSRKDGSDGIIRGNDIVVKSIEKEVEAY